MSTIWMDRDKLTDFHQWCSSVAEDMTRWRDHQMLAEQQLDSNTYTGMVHNGIPVALGVGDQTRAATTAGAIIAERLSEALEAHKAITEALNAIGNIVRRALDEATETDETSEQQMIDIMVEYGYQREALLKAVRSPKEMG